MMVINSQVFSRMPLHLGFSDVFLMISLGLQVFGKNTTKGMCPNHIISGGA